MQKIKARVVETLTISKEVEVTIPGNADEVDVDEMIRETAYAKTIWEPDSGWEGVSTDDVTVRIFKDGEWVTPFRFLEGK